MPGKKLSVEQLQDVKDRLVALGSSSAKCPAVLVPFGRQAFFPGRLQLDRGSHIHNVSTGEPPRWVASREEAIEKLRDEIAALKPLHTGDGTTIRTQQPSTRRQTTPTNAAAQQPNTTPFVEIREEVDDCGEVTKSQTVDVTKHLEHLELHDEELTGGASHATPTEHSKLEYWEPSPPPRGTSEDEHAALMQRLSLIHI